MATEHTTWKEGDEAETASGAFVVILKIDRHQAYVDLGWDSQWVPLHELRETK